LAARARLLRNHGAEQRYFHQRIGGNFRLDPLQAALLSVKLEHLDNYTELRRSHAAYYSSKLRELDGVTLPAVHADRRHIWNQYTLRVHSRRDALKEFLASRGIGSEIYYPRPLHLQECFAHPYAAPPQLPVSEQLAEECISIPIYPELTREQLDAVIVAIAEFQRAGTLS
jgi:dTDP-4-amino-4,6-dideoxygalactose transaminase